MLEAFPDFVMRIWTVALLVLVAGISRAVLVLRARRVGGVMNAAAPDIKGA